MADMWRSRCVWTGVPGSPAVGTFYHLHSDGTAQTAVDAVAVLAAAFASFQPSQVNWQTEELVSRVDPANGNVTDVVSVTPDEGSGDASGLMLPSAAQLLIEWRTGVFRSGREVRGRTNIPYVTSILLGSNGEVSAGLLPSLSGFAQDFISEPGNLSPAVWSRAGHAAYDVNTGNVWDQFAIIRSRRD